MPPDGFLSRKPRTGESTPSGSKSSILLFGSSTKTTVTAVFRQGKRRRDLGAERALIPGCRGGEIRDKRSRRG